MTVADQHKFILEFEEFIEQQLRVAIENIRDLRTSARTHIQKLLYTNLVDRFDVTIDKAILTLSKHPPLSNELISSMKDPLNKGDLFDLLLLNEPNRTSKIHHELENIARNSITRGRHSTKLLKLLTILGKSEENNIQNNPCVHVNSGNIGTKLKKHPQIPNSITGYADWLYSKRNAVVHGNKDSLSKQDKQHIEKTYRVTLSKNIKFQPGSLMTAMTFYLAIVRKLRQNEILKLL